MALTLHSHPLASFCWKVLIGLYENETPFESVLVDLGNPASRAALLAISPMSKMPVLQDRGRGETVFETTVILEYLDLHHPGPVRFTPLDPDLAWRTRLWDRFFDQYVQGPMQKIVGDRIRPEGSRDPFGVEEARERLAQAYDHLEHEIVGRTWLTGGDVFGLAECAASPALYYADKVQPLGDSHPQLAAYLGRLEARPAFKRALSEAEPYAAKFPTG